MRFRLSLLVATIALASGFLAPRGNAQSRGARRDRASGCADGQREAFRNVRRYPDIAGCAGGWDIPGIADEAEPHCERHGGDDGTNPPGESCNVTDLCEAGWHVCRGPSDVAASSRDGCRGAHDAVRSFFVTRASGPGCGVCATGTATDCTGFDCRTDCAPNDATHNDVFGCGTIGAVPDRTSCGVLDRFSHDECSQLPSSWACYDDGTGQHEAETLTHASTEAGGVLCCRDR